MKVDLLPQGRDQPFYEVLVDERDRPGGQTTYGEGAEGGREGGSEAGTQQCPLILPPLCASCQHGDASLAAAALVPQFTAPAASHRPASLRPRSQPRAVAQENILRVRRPREVQHPMLPRFFSGFSEEEGLYVPGPFLREVYPSEF